MTFACVERCISISGAISFARLMTPGVAMIKASGFIAEIVCKWRFSGSICELKGNAFTVA